MPWCVLCGLKDGKGQKYADDSPPSMYRNAYHNEVHTSRSKCLKVGEMVLIQTGLNVNPHPQTKHRVCSSNDS